MFNLSQYRPALSKSPDAASLGSGKTIYTKDEAQLGIISTVFRTNETIIKVKH